MREVTDERARGNGKRRGSEDECKNIVGLMMESEVREHYEGEREGRVEEKGKSVYLGGQCTSLLW